MFKFNFLKVTMHYATKYKRNNDLIAWEQIGLWFCFIIISSHVHSKNAVMLMGHSSIQSPIGGCANGTVSQGPAPSGAPHNAQRETSSIEGCTFQYRTGPRQGVTTALVQSWKHCFNSESTFSAWSLEHLKLEAFEVWGTTVVGLKFGKLKMCFKLTSITK